MLFTSNDGTFVDIKKHDFKNDSMYYEKLLDIKKTIPKSNKRFHCKDNKQPNK